MKGPGNSTQNTKKKKNAFLVGVSMRLALDKKNNRSLVVARLERETWGHASLAMFKSMST